MGVIIELSYRTGAPHCTNDLLIQTSPKKNTDDPSYRQVAASNAGPRDRGANVQLQNPSWWDATEDAPPAECQVEQLIAGAVHHWEKPSTRAIFTRETNHWFPLLICWYNHWYTSLTLCSVGKTIFENHERGKKIKKSLQWLIKSYCRGHPWIHKMCHFGILLAASNWVPSGNLT